MRHCIALVAALGLGLTACGDVREPRPDPLRAAAIDERPGTAVPLDTAFRDETGRLVTLRGLAGNKPLLIAPVQHDCPHLCGLTLEGLATAIRGQDLRPGRDFVVVALGIDPRETAQQARRSQTRLAATVGGSRGLHAVTGRAQQIRAVTDALGYRFAYDPQLNQYAHLAGAAVITPHGLLTGWIYGVAPEPADFHAIVEEARRDRVGGLGARILLLCHHLAPGGRFTGAALAALRWGGLFTVLALGTVIAASAARRRRANGP